MCSLCNYVVIRLLQLLCHYVTPTKRNHGLFDWKTRPKITHFDIWSI